LTVEPAKLSTKQIVLSQREANRLPNRFRFPIQPDNRDPNDPNER
jgi:hypothetical protein